MDEIKIEQQMSSHLKKAAELLSDWLDNQIVKTQGSWFEDCVLAKLSNSQRETVTKNGWKTIRDLDLIFLLRLADKSWYELKNAASFPSGKREIFRAMMRVRNNWANNIALTVFPSKDTVICDLEVLKKFFLFILSFAQTSEKNTGDGEELIRQIDYQIEEAKRPTSFANFQTQVAKPSEIEPALQVQVAEHDIVYLVAEPKTHGVVMSINDVSGTKKYNVFVNGAIKEFFEGQIALVETEEGATARQKKLDVKTFLTFLTAHQINNPVGNNLYSLNSARIDFVSYQFRPALKLLRSDEPRILIADSVGVGKTIEAGLIIKELQARSELNNIVIICPKPLVAERKWELEMKRFDEEFVPVDGKQLRRIISDTHRDGEWPVRFNRAIIPYSILDGSAYGMRDSEKKASKLEDASFKSTRRGKRRRSRFQGFGLVNLDPPPHFDLVIVDEAHRIRNGSMEKEKAFEYKCVKYFCDNADAVVMLTATPIQTSSDNLFVLLNVLRPDLIIDKDVFEKMTKPNPSILKCARLIRRAGKDWQQEVAGELKAVLETQYGENVIAKNPVYAQLLQTLSKETISRDERVKLISDVESLNTFSSILNRTRRKDIQDFCVRRPFTVETQFTPQARALHDKLLEFEAQALLQLHGNVSIKFMLATLRRQVASCVFALAPHINDLINRRFDQLDEYIEQEEEFYSDVEEELHKTKESTLETLRTLADELICMSKTLPPEDPKFDSMMKVILEKQAAENNKIIIFSSFRHTLRYLYDRIETAGLRVAQINGSVKDSERQSLRSRFELDRSEKAAVDILLFTEVGSEGLDYQFCDMIINYDLPWNPMRIEQRIGRIDRHGQKSEAVSIYNLITSDTIDAEIYYRCFERIGVFQQSIGDCEEILGEITTQIEKIVYDPTLTDEERKTKLDQMTDNEIRKIQELNKLEEDQKELFGFDLSENITSREIQNAENAWISPENLQNMIEQYLTLRLGEGNYILGKGELKNLRLSLDARKSLKDDFQKLPASQNAVRQSWSSYLKSANPNQKITFDQSTAQKNRDAFFITSTHPLAKQAAKNIADTIAKNAAYIEIDFSSQDIATGVYYFSVYAWDYVGINPHVKNVVVCENEKIAKEFSDILQNAKESEIKIKINLTQWKKLEEKHLLLWKAEKDKYLLDAENTANFKIESLTTNFNRKEKYLRQKINDSAQKESLIRMYESQLASAKMKYNEKIESIRSQKKQSDIYATLIANGILNVAHNLKIGDENGHI